MDMRKYALAALPAALAGLMALSACGTAEEEPAANGTVETQAEAEYNAADVEFAQGMIPHHEQAVDMSELARTRAGSEDVADLAERIEAAQDPEIQELTEMLQEWGEDPRGGHGADHSMHGMMTQEQMAELEGAEGEEFDRLFLRMMIEHHQGAVVMAREHLEEGVNPQARQLSQEITDLQEEEIAEMGELLGEPVGEVHDEDAHG